MKRLSLTLSALFGLFLACSGVTAAAAPDAVLIAASKLAIEPSSASLAGGKARLTTTTLQRQAGNFVGNYNIKVFPYYFKNETGTLSVAASDEALRKLAAGATVNFAGKAVTAGTGKTRAVRVKATPADAVKGSLNISIPTVNGELVFDTVYTLGGR